MTDAEAFAWLDDLVVRLKVCAVSLVVAFVVAAIPIPFLPHPTPAQIVIEIVTAPASTHLQYLAPGEGFWTYGYVVIALMLVLIQPVLLWQLLDLTAPPDVPRRSREIALVVVIALAAFVSELALWPVWVLPASTQALLSWNTGVMDVKWWYSEYVGTVVSLMFLLGLPFELPSLVFGVVWVRIISRARIAKYRSYAVLLTFVFGAVVTPTVDMLNQAIVAVPTYLLFELGLLLARFVPVEDERRAVD